MNDFEKWYTDNSDKIVTFTHKQICEAVWNGAMESVKSGLTPFAWATDEEQPRFISDRTKKTSLFKSAIESFKIPLFKI